MSNPAGLEQARTLYIWGICKVVSELSPDTTFRFAKLLLKLLQQGSILLGIGMSYLAEISYTGLK